MGTFITILAFVFVIGLCIGSFLNVVILRALSNESIVFPASKCPKCQTPLKWWHNIPVLSYILLRGKCAYCKEHISIQYPIVELLTAIIFTLLFLKYGIAIDLLFLLPISALLIVIAGTDIKEKVVFDAHVYSLIGVALLYALYILVAGWYFGRFDIAGLVIPKFSFWHNPLTISILGALAGAAIMEIFARAGYLAAGTRAFGEGDTLIAAGLGAVFGWYQLIFVLIASVVIQVIVFIPLFIKGLVKSKEWITLVLFLGFVFYTIVFCFVQNKGLIQSNSAYIAAVLALAFLGIATCVFILKGLREHPENRTYMPFGPAMVVAAFICMLL